MNFAPWYQASGIYQVFMGFKNPLLTNQSTRFLTAILYKFVGRGLVRLIANWFLSSYQHEIRTIRKRDCSPQT